MEINIQNSFNKLLNYIESENRKGYDPYDTLNSWVPFHWLGKWGPILAIQFQKRNPINIRPFLGIKKDYNPKAMGLFLRAYSILYAKTNKKEYLDKADFTFEWLKDNYSKGYSGYCWGYNFPWYTPEKTLPAFTPSSVVTGTNCKGIWQYYKATQDKKTEEALLNSAKFLLNDLPRYEDKTGLCISYTPVKKDICYNASLLAGETLAMCYNLTGESSYKDLCIAIVDFAVARQKEDGRWNYSQDIKTGQEREQIDFHQGYIIESIFEIKKLITISDSKWDTSIEKGLKFYRNRQFLDNGQALWRLPKKYPVDIHNQAQGIITFSSLKDSNSDYLMFARKIAIWTIENMQSNDGYFYYRRNKYFTNKIPCMRWSQAWMLLALSYFYKVKIKK